MRAKLTQLPLRGHWGQCIEKTSKTRLVAKPECVLNLVAVLEVEEAARRKREGMHGTTKTCAVRGALGSGASDPGLVPVWPHALFPVNTSSSSEPRAVSLL